MHQDRNTKRSVVGDHRYIFDETTPFVQGIETARIYCPSFFSSSISFIHSHYTAISRLWLISRSVNPNSPAESQRMGQKKQSTSNSGNETKKRRRVGFSAVGKRTWYSVLATSYFISFLLLLLHFFGLVTLTRHFTLALFVDFIIIVLRLYDQISSSRQNFQLRTVQMPELKQESA